MSNIASRISALRACLAQKNLSAWIVFTGDPHLSEYLPRNWAFRAYLSGFTGSAGTLVVTQQKVALWTDSRYWEQAAHEIAGTEIVLMKDGAAETPSIGAWLSTELPAKSRIGTNFLTASSKLVGRLRTALARHDIVLTGQTDVECIVWMDRPGPECHPVTLFPFGQTPCPQKLAAVRGQMQDEGADALFVSTLDDIAWITNLRGSDIACNPVFTAYLLVEKDSATLFADVDRFSTEIQDTLRKDGFTLLPYEAAQHALEKLSKEGTLWLDGTHTCEAFVAKAHDLGIRLLDEKQPTTLLKAKKTPEELDLLRQTMVTDGVALCELYAWLDEALEQGQEITEWDVSEKLHEYRSRSAEFIEESFTTIAAVGANAALPHYTPKKETAALLTKPAMLLIDSGGQYRGGTTDITRTTAVGWPTDQMRRDYTAVLQGHINLALAKFPDGTYSSQLDTFARAPLWECGLDFGHGTGHGVGFCLSVHEGPVSISPRCPTSDQTRVHEGLVVSNEPGLYRTGQWGIRTENLVTPVATQAEAEFRPEKKLLTFETLSLCPIDTRLIFPGMLTPLQIWWVNDYNRRVREALRDKLSDQAKQWIDRATEIA